MVFGIPEKDLEKTWNINIINTVSGATPLLNNRDLNSIEVHTYVLISYFKI